MQINNHENVFRYFSESLYNNPQTKPINANWKNQLYAQFDTAPFPFTRFHPQVGCWKIRGQVYGKCHEGCNIASQKAEKEKKGFDYQEVPAGNGISDKRSDRKMKRKVRYRRGLSLGQTRDTKSNRYPRATRRKFNFDAFHVDFQIGISQSPLPDGAGSLQQAVRIYFVWNICRLTTRIVTEPREEYRSSLMSEGGH